MENGVWRTISGRRVFIKEGESLSSAMRKSGKFKIKSQSTQKINKKVLDTLDDKTKSEIEKDKEATRLENEYSETNKYELKKAGFDPQEKQRIETGKEIARELYGKYISDEVAERVAREQIIKPINGEPIEKREDYIFNGKYVVGRSQKYLDEWLKQLKKKPR